MISFFFQAEDGIRDLTVTGVQTCALPICAGLLALAVATVVRERAATVAIVRTVGAQPGQVRLLVGGIAAAHLAIALPAAVLLERYLLGPAVSRLIGRYGELPVGVHAGDALLVLTAA